MYSIPYPASAKERRILRNNLCDRLSLRQAAREGNPEAIATLIATAPIQHRDLLRCILGVDPTNLDEHGDPIVN